MMRSAIEKPVRNLFDATDSKKIFSRYSTCLNITAHQINVYRESSPPENESIEIATCISRENNRTNFAFNYNKQASTNHGVS